MSSGRPQRRRVILALSALTFNARVNGFTGWFTVNFEGRNVESYPLTHVKTCTEWLGITNHLLEIDRLASEGCQKQTLPPEYTLPVARDICERMAVAPHCAPPCFPPRSLAPSPSLPPSVRLAFLPLDPASFSPPISFRSFIRLSRMRANTHSDM